MQNSQENTAHCLPELPELPKLIDHTLLKADATFSEIQQMCNDALAHGFAGVCVNSSWIPQVAQALKGSTVLPVAVVGFPLGACDSETKAFETRRAVQNGACEIDMVIAVGRLKEKALDYVLDDIRAVVEAALPHPVKVIIEACLLSDSEKVTACQLAKKAGAAFVKTSTGFSLGGARVEDVRLMRETVGPEMGVKASGGIRTFEHAMQMVKAGATRIGASAGAALLKPSASQPAQPGSY